MFNTSDATASAHILDNRSLPTLHKAEEAASPSKPTTRSAKKKRQAEPEHLSALPLKRQDPEHPASALDASASTSTNLPLSNQVVGKTNVVISLLRRETGATLSEMMAATDWQAHSVRGFLSGTVRKKLGLNLCSEVLNDGLRRCRIKRLCEGDRSARADASEIIDLPPFGPFKGAHDTGASTAETAG